MSRKQKQFSFFSIFPQNLPSIAVQSQNTTYIIHFKLKPVLSRFTDRVRKNSQNLGSFGGNKSSLYVNHSEMSLAEGKFNLPCGTRKSENKKKPNWFASRKEFLSSCSHLFKFCYVEKNTKCQM